MVTMILMTTDVVSNSNVDTANANSQVVQIINLLGGRDNIEDVDACMTRLRVSVKDVAQVGDENAWKQAGAMGLIIKDSGVQAVYGPKADVLKSDIQDLSRIWCCNSSIQKWFLLIQQHLKLSSKESLKLFTQ